MKNIILRKTSMLCVILMLVICMIFSGCAGRRSISAEEFSAAFSSHDLALTDNSANYDPSFLTTALVYNETNCSIGYYTFAKASDAKTYYAQYFGSIYGGTSDEKYIDSSEYNRYFMSDSENLVLLYRNGTNLIYVVGTDIETLGTIIDELGI